ncbi:MAG: T9SS type A sorting domain-containing protein [Bacteroidota bacterium]
MSSIFNALSTSLFICCCLPTNAQIHDNIWLFGDSGFDNTSVEFVDGEPKLRSFDTDADLVKSASSICDSSGHLVLFTDGCNIYDAQGEIIDNGEMINPGDVWDDYCGVNSGYPQVLQSSMFLPWPDDSSQFILFHKEVSLVAGVGVVTAPLFYTRINSVVGGGWEVTEKNVVLYDETPTIESGQLTASKHANGRDWWITNRLEGDGGFMVFLLTPNGVEGPFFQSEVWYSPPHEGEGGGESEFSSNGLRYVYHRPKVGMEVHDFDRETGLFTLTDTIPQFDFNEIVTFNGLGLSPSGRFAYISEYFQIFQYDLEADNIADSKTLIHTFLNPDSLFIEPHGMHFQLGPDCRLYNFMNSGRYIHRINEPDLPGLACGFEENAFELPFSAFRDQPQFPHFRLGPLGDEGSPCVESPNATASVDGNGVGLKVYPNPSLGPIRLWLPAGEATATWRLYDLQGRPLHELTLLPGQNQRLDLAADLPAGTYFWQLSREGKVVETGKLFRQ